MAIPPFKTLEGHDDDPFRAAADDDGGLDPFGLEARYGPSYFHFDDDDEWPDENDCTNDPVDEESQTYAVPWSRSATQEDRSASPYPFVEPDDEEVAPALWSTASGKQRASFDGAATPRPDLVGLSSRSDAQGPPGSRPPRSAPGLCRATPLQPLTPEITLTVAPRRGESPPFGPTPTEPTGLAVTLHPVVEPNGRQGALAVKRPASVERFEGSKKHPIRVPDPEETEHFIHLDLFERPIDTTGLVCEGCHKRCQFLTKLNEAVGVALTRWLWGESYSRWSWEDAYMTDGRNIVERSAGRKEEVPERVVAATAKSSSTVYVATSPSPSPPSSTSAGSMPPGSTVSTGIPLSASALAFRDSTERSSQDLLHSFKSLVTFGRRPASDSGSDDASTITSGSEPSTPVVSRSRPVTARGRVNVESSPPRGRSAVPSRAPTVRKKTSSSTISAPTTSPVTSSESTSTAAGFVYDPQPETGALMNEELRRFQTESRRSRRRHRRSSVASTSRDRLD